MRVLHGAITILRDSEAAFISFCRCFCFSAFFLAPVFFLGIVTWNSQRVKLEHVRSKVDDFSN